MVAIAWDNIVPKLALMGICPFIQARLPLHRTIKPATINTSRRIVFILIL